MSRTIRRKNTKVSKTYWSEDDFTHDWVTHEDSSNYMNRVKKDGKAFKKGWWKFHGDKYPVHCRFHLTWKQVRVRNRQDMHAWACNEDHELVFFELLNKRDWFD